MNINRVTYEVNPVKKIVRAYISECDYDAFRELNKRFTFPQTSKFEIFSPVPTNFGNVTPNIFVMPSTMSAVARCSNEDEFSEEEGKRRAMKKLAKKYNRAIGKRLRNFEYYITQMSIEMGSKLYNYDNERKEDFDEF